MRLTPTTLACLGLVVLTGCARLQWTRTSVEEPIPDARFAALRPGESDLTACLAELGAPLRVWEQADAGVALAYGWLDSLDWGFNVSYTPVRLLAVSLNFAEVLSRMRGVVLLLDDGLTLRQIKRGLLRDLTVELGRRRPAEPDDAQPDGVQPDGAQPDGPQPDDAQPDGPQPGGG